MAFVARIEAVMSKTDSAKKYEVRSTKDAHSYQHSLSVLVLRQASLETGESVRSYKGPKICEERAGPLVMLGTTFVFRYQVLYYVVIPLRLAQA